jgi:hypothetical protein
MQRLSFKENQPLQADDLYVPSSLEDLALLTGHQVRQGYERAVVCGNTIVNVVSKSYGHMPNENFFIPILSEVDDLGMEYMTRTINRKNRSFAMDIILNDPSVTIELKGGKDNIKPMLRFLNSYDGSLRASGSFGYYRQVCSNGLHISHSKIGFKIKHHSNIEEVVMPEISTLVKHWIDNEYYTLRRKFEVMYDSVVSNPREYIKQICDTTGLFQYEKSVNNPEPSKKAELVYEIARRESHEIGCPINNWTMYNAFNNVLHNHMNKNFNSAHAVDNQLFNLFSNN